MVEKSDHDMIKEVHTVLLGVNNQGGLCRSHECLKRDFYKFRLWVIVFIATSLVGGGVTAWKGLEILARAVR